MTAQTRLFVGGIPEGANSDTVNDSFSNFGHVVSCELKRKPTDPDNQFAFITLKADQEDVEACIRHFSQSEWCGRRLHVTRARESFLERLQKERQQTQTKKPCDFASAYKSQEDYTGILKIRTAEVTDLNTRTSEDSLTNGFHKEKKEEKTPKPLAKKSHFENISYKNEKCPKQKFTDDKKLSSDNKRLESMKKMRQQFNKKNLLLKIGLANVDKASNKRIKFDDNEAEQPLKDIFVTKKTWNICAGKTLFEDDSGDDQDNVTFQIKEQFEGRKGQKVLELQSRFKSDKRFTLDEKFIEDEHEDQGHKMELEDEVQVLGENEKSGQLSILQSVLGVSVKSVYTQPQALADNKKTKGRMGMLRFDPNQPDHVKFLSAKESIKKDVDSGKKKKKNSEEPIEAPQSVVEVSKEQFYKVSDTLKEAIAQPSTFSLRSLFAKDDENGDDKNQTQDTGHTSLPAVKKHKLKNPFDKTAKNPFKYDSSDSEPELEEKEDVKAEPVEDSLAKAVWREKLFFTRFDNRFKEGLAFFNGVHSANKERRELKSLVKKRLYNRARKDQMFQKKIGGKRKNFRNDRKQQR